MAPKKKKEANTGGSQAPEAAALQHLGIAIGSKNLRTIKKEEIDLAFINQLHESEYRLIGGPVLCFFQHTWIVEHCVSCKVKSQPPVVSLKDIHRLLPSVPLGDFF
jgi:hypothetical protein